jgi:hypothetical protein
MAWIGKALSAPFFIFFRKTRFDMTSTKILRYVLILVLLVHAADLVAQRATNVDRRLSATDVAIESKIAALIARMTLVEKLGAAPAVGRRRETESTGRNISKWRAEVCSVRP